MATPYYAPAWAFGGPPELVRSLGINLARLDGWNVRVVTSTALSPHEDLSPGPATVDSLPVLRVARAGWPWPVSYFRMPSLGRVARRQTELADAVLLHGMWTDVDRVVSRECRRLGIPYLVYTHGTFTRWALAHHGPKKIAYFPLFERVVLAGAAGIVLSNDEEASELRRRGIDVPLRRIPGGVDLPEGPDPLAGTELLERIAGRPFVLCLARLHPQKGLDVLIDAFAAALADRGFVLVLAGPDGEGHGPGLVARAERHGIADRVLFPGLVTGDEKEWLLRNAAIYAQLSRSEGHSVAVLEALAHGLPMVLTEAAAFPELAGGDAAALTELDAGAAATILQRLADGPVGAGANARGRALAEELFAWPAIARRTADFIEECADR